MNESKNFVHLVVHFMKWTVDFFIHFTKWTNILSISRNGQLGCPFHEMDNLLVHFTKWTISHLGHNIYILCTICNKTDAFTCHSGPAEELQQAPGGIIQSLPMQDPLDRTE